MIRVNCFTREGVNKFCILICATRNVVTAFCFNVCHSASRVGSQLLNPTLIMLRYKRSAIFFITWCIPRLNFQNHETIWLVLPTLPTFPWKLRCFSSCAKIDRFSISYTLFDRLRVIVDLNTRLTNTNHLFRLTDYQPIDCFASDDSNNELGKWDKNRGVQATPKDADDSSQRSQAAPISFLCETKLVQSLSRIVCAFVIVACAFTRQPHFAPPLPVSWQPLNKCGIHILIVVHCLFLRKHPRFAPHINESINSPWAWNREAAPHTSSDILNHR